MLIRVWSVTCVVQEEKRCMARHLPGSSFQLLSWTSCEVVSQQLPTGGPYKATRWRATFRNTALQPWWQARLARSSLLCLVPSLSFQELTLDVRERLGVARSRPLPISGCRWDGSWQLADFQLRLCSFQGCQGSAAKTPLPAQAC